MLFVLLLAIVLARAAAGFWLAHRVRLALLALLERHPELFLHPENPSELLAKAETVAPQSHNYALTGLFLAAFGVGGVIYGLVLGLGRLASGAYVGGLICLVLALCWAVGGHLFQSTQKKG
jgi:hypothetical protein